MNFRKLLTIAVLVCLLGGCGSSNKEMTSDGVQEDTKIANEEETVNDTSTSESTSSVESESVENASSAESQITDDSAVNTQVNEDSSVGATKAAGQTDTDNETGEEVATVIYDGKVVHIVLLQESDDGYRYDLSGTKYLSKEPFPGSGETAWDSLPPEWMAMINMASSNAEETVDEPDFRETADIIVNLKDDVVVYCERLEDGYLKCNTTTGKTFKIMLHHVEIEDGEYDINEIDPSFRRLINRALGIEE